MEPPARLSVRRDTGANDLFRAYRILVDGDEVGAVRRGCELSVAIAPGVHTIEARLDWCTSRPVTISAAPGDHVQLAVRNGLEGWRALLVIVAVLWRTHEYLLVEHVSGGGRPPQRPTV